MKYTRKQNLSPIHDNISFCIPLLRTRIELTKINFDCVASEFLKLVVIKIMTFLVVMLCILVERHKSFANTCYIDLDYKEAIHSNSVVLLEKKT
jgi:hypothetical protein